MLKMSHLVDNFQFDITFYLLSVSFSDLKEKKLSLTWIDCQETIHPKLLFVVTSYHFPLFYSEDAFPLYVHNEMVLLC